MRWLPFCDSGSTNTQECENVVLTFATHACAGAAPVDLGQRGVVLRCLEALTGDGQLLVRNSTERCALCKGLCTPPTLLCSARIPAHSIETL